MPSSSWPHSPRRILLTLLDFEDEGAMILEMSGTAKVLISP